MVVPRHELASCHTEYEQAFFFTKGQLRNGLDLQLRYHCNYLEQDVNDACFCSVVLMNSSKFRLIHLTTVRVCECRL
ncbi:unnamed protein product [Clavelina lepadiformis]|uniref:Uncharacterized protein n=1 Tax=Clavelina lepadiformis TaxID=159417 RepID=A0ABP0H1W8_CLALP